MDGFFISKKSMFKAMERKRANVSAPSLCCLLNRCTAPKSRRAVQLVIDPGLEPGTH